jgi:hypothetical protein
VALDEIIKHPLTREAQTEFSDGETAALQAAELDMDVERVGTAFRLVDKPAKPANDEA